MEPIAIIGIGCRFPGGADSPALLWDNLCLGVDAIRKIPHDRWDIGSFYDPNPGKPGKTYSQWGGFLDQIDLFDPAFFFISHREASLIDPQQRLLLEVAWEALEDAGQVVNRARKVNAGVFVGICTTDYNQIQYDSRDKSSINAYSATGGSISIAANRMSFCLNFSGPSVAVDTACSSSLVAVDLACRSIWNGECDLALAGGVNAIIIPDPFIGFCKAAMLSPHGRCKTFDASADGFVRGEGAGIIVLKSLPHAINAGDHVYAVIRATGVNQDGRSSGLTVPDEQSQLVLIREVCRKAGVSPAQLDYIEAHGTGTPVGDPIEANAIGKAVSAERPDGSSCVVGSVKTNIGHLEGGAGIAGLIKTALCVKNRQIPRNLHFHTPNPLIPFEELQLRVPTSLEAWPSDNGPVLAGVNSFGFGGTNAHVLLGEAPDFSYGRRKTKNKVAGKPAEKNAHLLTISTRSEEALNSFARVYMDFLTQSSLQHETSFHDICYTASLRRTHLDHRLALVARTKEEAVSCLQAFLDGERRTGMYSGRYFTGKHPKLVFVFSGQGPQWWAMGRQLLKNEQVFRETLEQCDSQITKLGDWSLIEELTAEESCSRMGVTSIAQPAIFSLQVALAALWRSWGIEPDVVVGHSVGEVAAAYVSGALSFEDAVRVIFHRGRCMELASTGGRMLAVGLSDSEMIGILADYEKLVSLAAINSPSSVTISGDASVLEKISKKLREQQVFCRFLPVDYAFHSPQMDDVREALLDSLSEISPGPALIPIFSSVTGQEIEGFSFNANYWWRNVRETVRFFSAIHRLMEKGYSTFLEISPHPVLSSSISESLIHFGGKGSILPSLRRKENEQVTMLGSLAKLYTLGFDVNWKVFYSHGGIQVKLPSYPWQRESFWHESEEARDARLGKNEHPLLGKKLKTPDPSWQNKLDMQQHSYLGDHCVQGCPVFPAAAYIEMALGAAGKLLGAIPCVLEDVEFTKALFLPADGMQMPSMQFTYYPGESFYQICSSLKDSDQSWNLHSSGKLLPLQVMEPRDIDMPDVIRARCPEKISGHFCYERLRTLGLHYGSCFQGVETIWRKAGEAIGHVIMPDTGNVNSDGYRFHPTILDACFQVLLGALPFPDGDDNTHVFLPVRIERFRFYCPPSDKLWSHVRILKLSAKRLEGNICIFDAEGRMVVEILGFTCQAVENSRSNTREKLDDWIYKPRWEIMPSLARRTWNEPCNWLPQLRKTAEFARNSNPWQNRFLEVQTDLNALCTAYIVKAFKELGWRPEPNSSVSTKELIPLLDIRENYSRLVERYLEILEEDGVLKRVHGNLAFTSFPPVMDIRETWKSILTRFPAYYAEMILVERCGNKLAEVLKGDMDPLLLLFPDQHFTMAEHLYQDSPSFLPYNTMVGEALSFVVSHLPKSRNLRVLEVGAGTGGLTYHVISKFPRGQTEYCFTDISNAFFARCKQKFRDYPFIEFKRLDIESDPTSQGFLEHGYDIILASDVLHATADLRDSLDNILRLLSSRGLLVLLEATRKERNADLIFGLTAGWWRFADPELRPSYPLLSRENWEQLLRDRGFEEVVTVPDGGGEEFVHGVFMARGPSLETEVSDIEIEQTVVPNRWLLFADAEDVAGRLLKLLTVRGDNCILVRHGTEPKRCNDGTFEIRPAHLEDMQWLFDMVQDESQSEIGNILYLWSHDCSRSTELTTDSLWSAQTLCCIGVMNLVKVVVESFWGKVPNLTIITRGAQTVGVEKEPLALAQTSMLGLGRVIAMEYPDLKCRLVDLSFEASDLEIDSLLKELGVRDLDDVEDEIALRGPARFVPRWLRGSLFSPPANVKTAKERNIECYQLKNRAPGVLDKLTLCQVKRQLPGPNQVEIKVYAAALNFRDVMKSLGIYPSEGSDDEELGDECAGRIVAVGEDVTDLQVGDEVIALASRCFSSHVIAYAPLVVKKPYFLSFDEAVTIPISFLTAWYTLHTLGGISAGDRVLIHAATGGVGLAAIQIAGRAGAEIFATAGTDEKRSFLKNIGVEHVMDSRSLAFADEVMEITAGDGVDVVLNSLAGEAISKGISILSPHGRFLEIGKRDIYQNSKLGLRALRNNISFFAIDLSSLIRKKPTLVKKMLQELMEFFEKGTFTPLPHRVFQVGKIQHAFRHMAQAKHIGKIVVYMRDRHVAVESLPRNTITFGQDGTYLITGGLGGFGLTMAAWLAQKGVRHLVLVGRSGTISDEAANILDTIEKMGVNIVVSQADVSREGDVKRVMDNIERCLPPLRGIMHAAMVIDDGILVQLNEKRFRNVLAPKILGAWNLHMHSQNMPLNFFVLFSSVASVIGNPGQSSYNVANSFLDSFAHYRRQLGLPAMAVNWGHLAKVGFLARHAEIGERLSMMGIMGIQPEETTIILERLLQENPVQMGVMHMNWHQLLKSYRNTGLAPRRFTYLLDKDGGEGQSGQEGSRIRDRILSASGEERRQLLETYLREQASRVLGTSLIKINSKQPLNELGMDSLMAVELKACVETDMGVAVPALELMQGPSISHLTALIFERLPAERRM